jgi:hypothetical protein
MLAFDALAQKRTLASYPPSIGIPWRAQSLQRYQGIFLAEPCFPFLSSTGYSLQYSLRDGRLGYMLYRLEITI